MGAVGAVFAALFAAHQVADHWIQSSHQSACKGLPGWTGRWNCVKHVATYTATAMVALGMLSVVTGWHPNAIALAAGLSVSAVTHYFADRRTPLKRLAVAIGSGGFWQLGAPRPDRDDNPSLGTGAYALDQSWHYGWLFVAALVISI